MTSTVRVSPSRATVSVIVSPGWCESIARWRSSAEVDFLAVDRGDDVAAGRVLAAVDRLGARAGPQSRFGGRRARANLTQVHARGGRARRPRTRRSWRRRRPGRRARPSRRRGSERRSSRRCSTGSRNRRRRCRRIARDLRVHADHPALQVEQRPARVAVVDRRVGLDRIVDREAVRRLHLAMESADDAGRDRLLEPERAADRHDAVADPELGRVAEAERSSTDAGASTLSTARSVDGSLPTTVASYVSPFENVTRDGSRRRRRDGW